MSHEEQKKKKILIENKCKKKPRHDRITICFFKLFHSNTVERPKKKRNEINNQSRKQP